MNKVIPEILKPYANKLTYIQTELIIIIFAQQGIGI